MPAASPDFLPNLTRRLIQAIESFLRREYPHYWLTYQQMPIRILAYDFFRYIAVYHYGGFYLDTGKSINSPLPYPSLRADPPSLPPYLFNTTDVVAERSFDALLPSKAVFPIDETIECWNSRWSYACMQLSINAIIITIN